jgi:hypothetical protein
MPTSAIVADLVRLEDEIDEALLNLLDRPAEASTIANLKRRKDHLRNEIECLMHEVEGAGRGPH